MRGGASAPRVEGLTYEEWEAQVSARLRRITGIGLEDGEDTDSWNRWNDGLSVGAATVETLLDWGFEMEGPA